MGAGVGWRPMPESEGEIGMRELIDWISAVEGVDEYKIVEKKTKTTEVFFVKQKIETVRATQTIDRSVTVYCRGDGTMGDSTFAVYASMGKCEVQKAAQTAVMRARLVGNPLYALAEGDSCNVTLDSNVRNQDPKQVAARIAAAVFGAPHKQGATINALEVFVTDTTTRVCNSKGLDRTQTASQVSFEAIPTWNEAGQSVELYQWYDASDLDENAIRDEVAAKLCEVGDRYHAKPIERGEYDVVLRATELHSLAAELSDYLSYRAVYSHLNPYGMGDNLQPERAGDALCITRLSKVAGSCQSRVFDQDGVLLQNKTLVDNGTVVGYWGDNRYGQYMGESADAITGALPCVGLGVGTMKAPTGNYLEIVSMSGIQLELYSDYIGGEIRLAYWHEGDKVTPVTGISMSGKLSRLLSTIRLSERSIAKGAYTGPDMALLPAMQIV